MMVKMPSDIGFSNDRYDLPELIVNKHVIENTSVLEHTGQVGMFVKEAKTFHEIRHEQKMTISKRCEKSVELAKDKVSVYWCNLNEESSLLKELDPNAEEIKGSMSIDKKEDILINFAEGNIDRIITKAKMTGMGLNWQHCNHSVFFPTYSYEQYYQAIRRFWRFGQKREVKIYMITTDRMINVIKTQKEKQNQFKEMQRQMTDAVNKNINNQITTEMKYTNDLITSDYKLLHGDCVQRSKM